MNNELNTKERKGWFEGRFEEFEGRHRFDCVACSKPMFFPKSKLGKYKTCGGECSTRMRESLRAERTKPCETCGQQFTPRPSQLEKGHGRYELDHIQPVSKGGKSDLGNLQILCPKCNRTKSAKDPIEFKQQKGYLL